MTSQVFNFFNTQIQLCTAEKYCCILPNTKVNVNFSSKNHTENDAGRLVPELLLFFKKALCEVKGSCLQLSFRIF